MITEDAMADLFEKAVQDLDPAIHALLVRAEERGRRLRVRRRVWLALASGLVVAAMAGTALAAPLAPSRPQAELTHRHVSAGQSASGHARPKHAVHTPAARPPRDGYPAGGFPKLSMRYRMTIEQMLHVLRGMLPAGSTLSNVNPYAATDGSLEADYNDGQGAVDLQLDIDPTVMFAPLSCPKPLWTNEGPRPPGALPVSCAMRTLPDGSIERDAVYYADSFGWYAISVYDQRPDGITVDISVGNGIIHTLPQVDRARPPGTLAEWEAVAESPGWHLKKGWHVEK